MLYSIDGHLMKSIPHRDEYLIWRDRLKKVEKLQPIIDELNSRIDQSNNVLTSSWIPGSDWTNTVYQPIYEVACNYNEEHSAFCFGLILWEVFMEREDEWYFHKSENIRGITYFKKI